MICHFDGLGCKFSIVLYFYQCLKSFCSFFSFYSACTMWISQQTLRSCNLLANLMNNIQRIISLNYTYSLSFLSPIPQSRLPPRVFLRGLFRNLFFSSFSSYLILIRILYTIDQIDLFFVLSIDKHFEWSIIILKILWMAENVWLKQSMM